MIDFDFNNKVVVSLDQGPSFPGARLQVFCRVESEMKTKHRETAAETVHFEFLLPRNVITCVLTLFEFDP